MLTNLNMSKLLLFDIAKSVEILQQTPYTLSRMLESLSPDWVASTGDSENWSPYDVIGHLIHGEETDWIPRAEIILAQGEIRIFTPYDRLAQFQRSRGKSLEDLLTEFTYIRNVNVEKLVRWQLTLGQLAYKGIHPELGEVTLAQLLATWVVHDLNHIQQIVKYLAAKYSENVGPWKAYLSILS